MADREAHLAEQPSPVVARVLVVSPEEAEAARAQAEADAREEVQTWRDVYDLSVADPVPAQVQLASTIADAVVRQLFGLGEASGGP